ncbi:hypothetical protein [Paenibacillus timonensis]|uniref:hypothetical protein n=1 Tax=Paenibacillus timonensis TaxID=225915 RepID=UPI003F9DCCCD
MKTNFWIILVSCLFGGTCSLMIGGIIFSRYQEGTVIPRVIILIVIVIVYYYFLRWRHEKVNTDMVLLNITLFVIFLFISPFLMTSLNKLVSLPFPSQINNTVEEITTILEQKQLPFEIDIKESKKQTYKYGVRVTIILVKTQQGELLKSEIDTLLRSLPAEELHITFYSRNRETFLGIVINKEKSIVGCSPYEMCASMDINY